jgi:phage baseplate assembly protein W
MASIFGVGLSYPFRFDGNGLVPGVKLQTASEEDLVQCSIEQILNTDISERPFLFKDGIPYGTRLKRALFQPSGVFADIFRYDVPKSLAVWEPRIVVMDVSAIQDEANPSLVVGSVVFRYRATNRVDNFVRPYRLSKPDSQR